LSLNDCIINLLNLKDENIKFDDNFYSEETIDHVESKMFHGILSYTVDCKIKFPRNATKNFQLFCQAG